MVIEAHNTRRRWPGPVRLALLTALLLGLAGCQAGGSGGASPAVPSAGGKARGLDGGAAAGAAAGNADDFLVVDCQLPAQVRRLGTRMTYLGPRRAVRTSGVDCAIRGGEYVSYDRADYRTALKVWLEPAKTGDPEAQTYVGEIYERGVAGAPDYETAAAWYQKAADQGYAPAQINLGQLYEQGLGVPQDQLVALNWYRRASGFDEAGLTFVVSSDVGDELQGLRDEVMLQRSEADRLRDEIRDLEGEIAEAVRARLEVPGPAELRELEEKRQALAEEREALQQERSLAAGALDELERLHGSLEAERRLLRAEKAELEQKRAAAQSGAAQDEIDRLLADLRARQVELNQKLEGLAGQESQHLEREANLNRREAELQALERELRAREAELAEKGQLIEARNEEMSQLDREIAEKRRLFEEERQRLAHLSQNQQVALAGPSIVLIDPRLPGGPVTRSLPVVRTRSGLAERQVIGKVEAPAGLLSLVINDLPQLYDEQNLFQVNVPLRNEGTEVQITAVDQQGKRSDVAFLLRPDLEAAAIEPALGPRVVPPPPPIDFGNFHALVIGNNEHTHLPALDTAINDAEAVADLLSEKYGFQVTLLRDANRYQILSELNRLRATLTEKDNLLIYYAGHGELDQTNMRGHWLPVDAEADNTANWISNVAITDVLNAMSARRVMVVADSCYSGALTRTALAQLEAGMSEEARVTWLRAMATKRARTALTSGGLYPTLDGGGGGHSVFARAFIDVLRDNEGLIEGHKVFQEVSAQVTYAASRVRFEQVPQYAPIKHAGHEAGEFFFLPRT